MKGGYWHPQIHMDDVGFLETMMIGTQSRIRIRALPVPVLSGPTSGETWWKDIKEWVSEAADLTFSCPRSRL